MLRLSHYLKHKDDQCFVDFYNKHKDDKVKSYQSSLAGIMSGLQKNFCLCTNDNCKEERCGISSFHSTAECFNSCLHYHNPHLNVVEPMPSDIGYNSMVMVRCEKCSYAWEVLAKSVLYGSKSCKCKMSKGERIVSEILDKLGIKYLYNKTIKGHGIRPDFQLVDFGYAIIEVDGRQHRESVSLFGGEAEYKKTQNRDEKKNQYCIDNNIPLLRLLDTEKPIEIKKRFKIT